MFVVDVMGLTSTSLTQLLIKSTKIAGVGLMTAVYELINGWMNE